jgi:hypothetical protein
MTSDGPPTGPGPSTVFEIPQILQRSWLRELRRFHDAFNYTYARSALRTPLFRLGFASERLGQWDHDSRTITISARHILSHPWESVLDTLRHEMAHQYVDEVLGLPGAPPHGEAFARACRMLRVEPSGTHHPGSIEGSSEKRDQILSRVKLLLALAKSPNEHEAANAMRMANRYLLEYNLDLSRVEAARRYETRWLGRCSARVQEWEYLLAHILQDHFFVEVIWSFSYDPVLDRRGRILEISGSPENLQMAEYVHHYVRHVADRMWEARLRQEDGGPSPPTRGGTKLQYLAGLLRGLKEKLDGHRVEMRDRLGLVWRGDPQLRDYFRWMNPRVRTTSMWGVTRGEGYHAGVRDGRNITIHRGVETRGGGQGQRCLPGPG